MRLVVFLVAIAVALPAQAQFFKRKQVETGPTWKRSGPEINKFNGESDGRCVVQPSNYLAPSFYVNVTSTRLQFQHIGVSGTYVRGYGTVGGRSYQQKWKFDNALATKTYGDTDEDARVTFEQLKTAKTLILGTIYPDKVIEMPVDNLLDEVKACMEAVGYKPK